MTWSELKRHLRSLGFEEPSTMSEYSDIVIDAVNRAMDWVYDTVVKDYQSYFSAADDFDAEDRPTHVTASTEDDFDIELPDSVVHIVALMAAHWLWLDDDERKAVMYWNEADGLIAGIRDSAARARKVKFTGGLVW